MSARAREGERERQRNTPFSRSLTPSLFLELWLPVLAWCGLIFGLSSIPHLRFFERDWLDLVFRKFGHMVEYAVLARLLARAFIGSTYWPWKKIFAASLVLSAFYSGTDEVHQRFVAGRRGSIRDTIIDTCGAWIALGFKP